jgi:hypothetical protein
MPLAMLTLLLGSQLMSAVPHRESAKYPQLHSGHDTLDELFTMTLKEVRENSVSHIRDGAFQNGQNLPCFCFETGELWHYVWTRDSAYAVDLGLGWLDPERSRETLLFKVSAARENSRFGAGPEIVQDTGSGGSWPISSDRVVWGLGAERLLPLLKDAVRDDFFAQAYEALKNTVETDRLVVFDPEHGLYRGEQSFLDWREQSYPSWTRDDVKAIAGSFALSTNVLHLSALRQASGYARQHGDHAHAERHARWAEELALRIREFFWLPERGLFSSMSSATHPAFPLEKFDLLGQSLAVLAGLMTPAEGQRLFSLYPLHEAGPPVLYPQLPATAIYHNRAVWPFVTAYAIKAAAWSGHAPFVTTAMQSLWDGAVRHGSHMENMEFLSGRTHVEDGPYSGPVVNSRRQLWSVAAFVSVILDGMFGITAAEDALHLEPRFTHGIARRWVPRGHVELSDLEWRGKRLHLVMHWPDLAGLEDGFLKVERILLNGQAIKGNRLNFADLAADNRIRLDLVPGAEVTDMALNQPNVGPGPVLSNADYKKIFAPMEPRLHWVKEGTLRIERREMNPTRWDIYRNGQLLVSGLTADTWDVPAPGCYTAIQKYEGNGLSSHPSPELCGQVWSMEFSRANGQLTSPDGASTAQDHGRPHFNDWGLPHQVLEVASFQVPQDGAYQLDLAFGNAFGPINTGMTAAVKWLEVMDQAGFVIQSEALIMPHQVNWDTWNFSSAATLHLKADSIYRLRLSDARNMSYLKHFELYTAGPGGADGPVNRVNISGVRLRALHRLP